mmetsp:Transcript_12833/g.26641  ORF Transcript_12833/g.26641 Transcript_12833/m.26641 type:complete len:291 (-) Transcript_12833:110-982(-)
MCWLLPVCTDGATLSGGAATPLRSSIQMFRIPPQAQVDRTLDANYAVHVLHSAAILPRASEEASRPDHPAMCLILEIDRVVHDPVCVHDLSKLSIAIEVWLLGRRQDERWRTHGISQLLLCLPFVELLAHLAAWMAPNPCLHLGGILASLRDSPSTPAEADATRPLHTSLAKVRVHVIKNLTAMCPIELLQPPLAFWDLLGFVVGLNGSAFEEVWHDYVVPTGSQPIAEGLMTASVGTKDVVHHYDAALPTRITSHVDIGTAEINLPPLDTVVHATKRRGQGSLWAYSTT